MGRPKSSIWNHFEESEKTAKCKFCFKSYFPNKNKITKHLLNCFKCPSDIKKVYNSEIATIKSPDTEVINNAEIIQIIDNITLGSTGDQSNMSFYSNTFSRTTDNESLNKMLARAVYVTGSPLSLVEHPLWKSFFEQLQSSFKLPSRKKLATTYLEEEYTAVKSKIADQLHSAQDLHLQCDGWSNIRNEGIINFIISKPDPVFVDFLITEDNKHTANYLQEEMQNIIEKYQPEKFFVVIGDNAKNMQKAFRLLKENFNHLVPLGCIAHTLHLSCNDIIKCSSIKKIIEKATLVVKTFKSSQFLSASLSKINKDKDVMVSLKLPSQTRWGSYIFCLESLISNKVGLQTLAVNESSSLSKELKTDLLSEDCFWNDILVLVEFIKPIVLWITTFESNKCLIHKVHQAFKELQNSMTNLLETEKIKILNDSQKKLLLEKFRERMSFADSPIYLAAALLDPSNQGCLLSDSEQIVAMEFIYEVSRNMDINVMTDLALYRSREGLWAKDFVWSSASSIEPLVWWKGICTNKNLTRVAVRILSAPVTSAATERSFSTFSWIHNKKRNRLTTTRAGKLTLISHNWSIELSEKRNIQHEPTNDDVPSCSNVPSTSKSRESVNIDESIFLPSDSSDSD